MIDRYRGSSSSSAASLHHMLIKMCTLQHP